MPLEPASPQPHLDAAMFVAITLGDIGSLASIVSLVILIVSKPARRWVARLLSVGIPKHEIVSAEEALESLPIADRPDVLKKLVEYYKPALKARLPVADAIAQFHATRKDADTIAMLARAVRKSNLPPLPLAQAILKDHADPDGSLLRGLIASSDAPLHLAVDWRRVYESAHRAGAVDGGDLAAATAAMGVPFHKIVPLDRYLDGMLDASTTPVCQQFIERFQADGWPDHYPIRSNCEYRVEIADDAKQLAQTVPRAFDPLPEEMLCFACVDSFDRSYKTAPKHLIFQYVLGDARGDEVRVGQSLQWAFDKADVFYREAMPIDPAGAPAAAVRDALRELQTQIDARVDAGALSAKCTELLGFELHVSEASEPSPQPHVPRLLRTDASDPFVWSLVFEAPVAIDWQRPVRLWCRSYGALALDRCSQFPLVLAEPTNKLVMSFDFSHAHDKLGRVSAEPFFLSGSATPNLKDGATRKAVEFEDAERWLFPGLLLVHWTGGRKGGPTPARGE